MTSLGFLHYSEINDNSTINSNIDSDKKNKQKHNATIKKRYNRTGNESENVQNMLKLINNSNGYENDGDDSGLVDFKPPPHAEVSSKEPLSSLKKNINHAEINHGEINDLIDNYETPLKVSNSYIENREESEQYKAVNDTGPRKYPAPLDSYEGYAALPKTYANDYYKNFVPFFNQTEQLVKSGITTNKDQLLDKLNYMIHLLEEQKDEKTGHVMEEVILYSFLGVFIIFIVDSFARAGKYTR
jgi:hypothetical protein